MTTATGFRTRRTAAPVLTPAQQARRALHDKLVFEYNGKYNNFDGWVNVKGGCINLDTLEIIPAHGITVEQFKTTIGM